MATIKKCMRRFDRVAVDAKAQISTPLMGDTTIDASLVQLGKGGGLLASDLFMGVGRVITVDLAMKNHPVRAIAKVLYEYRNPAGKVNAGIGFEYMNESHGSRLNDFLDTKLEKSQTAPN